MNEKVNGRVATNEYIVEFYLGKDCHGVSSSGCEKYPSDKAAIEAAKKQIEEDNIKYGCHWKSVQVMKRNGYWPANGGLFCGTDDEIFRMNYEPKKDDDSPREFYSLNGWRTGLNQDCSFRKVIMRPSETHFEDGLRYDKDHNRVCTWSEKIALEDHCACD